MQISIASLRVSVFHTKLDLNELSFWQFYSVEKVTWVTWVAVLLPSHICCKHQVSTKPHVLVASSSISLFYLEGRIYIITLVNSLPFLTALRILQETLSLTPFFMINSHPLVGCLKNSVSRKSKTSPCLTRNASSHLVYCSSVSTT